MTFVQTEPPVCTSICSLSFFSLIRFEYWCFAQNTAHRQPVNHVTLYLDSHVHIWEFRHDQMLKLLKHNLSSFPAFRWPIKGQSDDKHKAQIFFLFSPYTESTILFAACNLLSNMIQHFLHSVLQFMGHNSLMARWVVLKKGGRSKSTSGKPVREKNPRIYLRLKSRQSWNVKKDPLAR